jgi:hypothetical protein
MVRAGDAMAEPVHEAVRDVRRQLRRVRWRQNAYELQRVTYLAIAAVAAAATIVVVLALATDDRTFAAGAGAVVLVALAATTVSVTATARRWLSARRAPAWIDARAGLRGRLATLVELAGGDGPERAFLPLLAERNAAGLDAWRPESVVPDTFPHGALGAAAAACSALAAVVILAPALPRPRAAATAGTLDRVAIDGIDARLRLRADDAAAAALAVLGDDDGAVGSVAASLRRRIRHAVGGPRWDDAPPPVASSEAGPVAETSAAPSDPAPQPSWDVARDRLARARHASADDAGTSETTAEGAAARDGRRAAADDPGTGAASPAGTPAAGAGTGTDPNLLGAAADGAPGTAAFALPIAARVRATGGGRRPASGETPAADPDARPALGDAQRRDAPIPHAEVAPAWEPVVRRLYAHREVR